MCGLQNVNSYFTSLMYRWNATHSLRQWWDFEVTLYSYACIKHETQSTTRILYVLRFVFLFCLASILSRATSMNMSTLSSSKRKDPRWIYEMCIDGTYTEQGIYMVNHVRPDYRYFVVKLKTYPGFVMSMTNWRSYFSVGKSQFLWTEFGIWIS